MSTTGNVDICYTMTVANNGLITPPPSTSNKEQVSKNKEESQNQSLLRDGKNSLKNMCIAQKEFCMKRMYIVAVLLCVVAAFSFAGGKEEAASSQNTPKVERFKGESYADYRERAAEFAKYFKKGVEQFDRGNYKEADALYSEATNYNSCYEVFINSALANYYLYVYDRGGLDALNQAYWACKQSNRI